MVLRLIRRVSDPEAFQPPFDDRAGFNEDWWVYRQVNGESNDWWSITDETGEDVARAEIDVESTSGDAYGVHAPPGGFTEIEFFEVRADRRRTGIGTGAIHLLTQAYTDRTFAAFSEDADIFWAALGWTGYAHPTDPTYRTLFISE
ncbi:hypothetical protein [Kribbella italica]|uniref:GNAT family N-acetyltransferase n=1 Tax=Kribbella italica TaxID=1540520 RepID=A0A7W9MXZ3_9ACTN|nr:hypothetical protein [Kribbella italica]MBB5840631.1 hypothetical protein [Kribbella italica]